MKAPSNNKLKPTMRCQKCNSEKIMPGLNITDRGHMDESHYLSIDIDRTPEALFFKNISSFNLCANVCGDCGNVELSIDNPNFLWEAYSQINDKTEIDEEDFQKWMEEEPTRKYLNKHQKLFSYRQVRAKRRQREE